MLRQFCILLILIVSVHPPAQGFKAAVACTPVSGRIFYIVKSGEHLSGILRAFGIGKPLWGAERGYVFRVSELNQLKDPNLIHPGDSLDLPFACEEMLVKFEVKQTNSGREVNQRLSRVTASDEKTEANNSLAPPPQARTQLEQLQGFKPYSRLRATGIYSFYRIDSKSSSSNATAIFLSSPSLGVNLSWQQAWLEKFSTEFYMSQTTVQMRDASSGTLLGGSKSLGKIGFGFDYGFTPDLLVKVDTSYGSQLFARAISVGLATLDSVYASRLGVAIVPTLIQKGALGLNLELGYFHIFPTSTNDYSLRTGEGFIIAPSVQHTLKEMQMELALKYEDIRQSSSISIQHSKEVGIHFRLSFEVGE